MNTTTKLAIIAISTAIISGCASYSHTRNDPTTGKAIETTHLRAPWLTKTTIAGLKTRVTDKHGTDVYSRTVGLETGTNSTDVEGIDALNRLIGNAVLSGLKSAAPIP